jgi:hypothetical protein
VNKNSADNLALRARRTVSFHYTGRWSRRLKPLGFILALLMLLGLAACSGNVNQSDPISEESAAASTVVQQPTDIPASTTAVPPTATATEVPASATAVPPTATATDIPASPTAVPPTATATEVPAIETQATQAEDVGGTWVSSGENSLTFRETGKLMWEFDGVKNQEDYYFEGDQLIIDSNGCAVLDNNRNIVQESCTAIYKVFIKKVGEEAVSIRLVVVEDDDFERPGMLQQRNWIRAEE